MSKAGINCVCRARTKVEALQVGSPVSHILKSTPQGFVCNL